MLGVIRKTSKKGSNSIYLQVRRDGISSRSTIARWTRWPRSRRTRPGWPPQLRTRTAKSCTPRAWPHSLIRQRLSQWTQPWWYTRTWTCLTCPRSCATPTTATTSGPTGSWSTRRSWTIIETRLIFQWLQVIRVNLEQHLNKIILLGYMTVNRKRQLKQGVKNFWRSQLKVSEEWVFETKIWLVKCSWMLKWI